MKFLGLVVLLGFVACVCAFPPPEEEVEEEYVDKDSVPEVEVPEVDTYEAEAPPQYNPVQLPYGYPQAPVFPGHYLPYQQAYLPPYPHPYEAVRPFGVPVHNGLAGSVNYILGGPAGLGAANAGLAAATAATSGLRIPYNYDPVNTINYLATPGLDLPYYPPGWTGSSPYLPTAPVYSPVVPQYYPVPQHYPVPQQVL